MEYVKTYLLDDWYILIVSKNAYTSNPREKAVWKLCIKPEYPFHINELGIDFGKDISSQINISDYYMFTVDIHKGDATTLSLAKYDNQASFDVTKGCGFIAYPKFLKEREAVEKATEEIKEYNQHISWEAFNVAELEPLGYERDRVDTRYGFHSIESILMAYSGRSPV